MLPSVVSFVENKLCYNDQRCQKIPEVLIKLYGLQTESLDLSYNELSTLRGLEGFPSLKELILDNNLLPDSIEFPYIPSLDTLSLNKNNIRDLELLISKIKENLPNLIYLSLLGNKACPNKLSGDENDEEDYQRYRYYVLYNLPKLKFLDSSEVKHAEKTEAVRRGKFMRIIRPNDRTDNTLENPSNTTYLTPLPSNMRNAADHKGAYGKCKYRYSGKNSEGNRFISNTDL